MDQESENIVCRGKCSHIVRESGSIDLLTRTCKKLSYNVLKSFEIQDDIVPEGFKCLGLIPEVVIASSQKCTHDRTRTVDMCCALEAIPVIHTFDLFIIHLEFSAEILYFLVSESHEGSKRTRVRHGKLIEHIQGRMSSILFNWKNACHISKSHIRLVF